MKISDALSWLMRDPGRARAVGRLLGAAQKGHARLETLQGRVLRAASIPVKDDLKLLSRQLAGLKRRLRDLDEKLDELSRSNPVDS